MTRTQRIEVTRWCFAAGLRVLAMVLLLYAIVVVISLMMEAMSWGYSLTDLLLEAPERLVVMLVACLTGVWLVAGAESLAKRLVPIRDVRCLKCGYRLEGKPVDRCPECGLYLGPDFMDPPVEAKGDSA